MLTVKNQIIRSNFFLSCLLVFLHQMLFLLQIAKLQNKNEINIMEYVFLDEMKSTNEIIQNMQIIIIKTHFAFHIYHTILSFFIKQNFIWHFNLQRYYLATSELWPKFLIACCHFPERDLDFQQSHKNQSVCNDKWNIYFLENWKWKIPMIRFSPI